MPPRRGDLGYGEWCMELIEQGRCSCGGCEGTLTDPARSRGGWGFCGQCGCAHKVGTLGGRRYAEWIPAFGRCERADENMARVRREQEEQARRRLRAEEHGDPRR